MSKITNDGLTPIWHRTTHQWASKG